MSEANPVDRKQFPLGRTLLFGGLLAIVAVVAFAYYRLYDGTRATFGEITAAEPTVITLPDPGEYILTRVDGISEDRTIAATITPGPTNQPNATDLEFITNDGSGFFTVKGKTNQILGGFVAQRAGPVTITANAAAYPLVVRRNSIDWAISCAKLAGVLGTIAAATASIGAFIAIQRFNQQQRQDRQAFQELIGEGP